MSKPGLGIVDTNRNDGGLLYPSPYEALACLIKGEGADLPVNLWEPAAGSGSLVRPLRNRGFRVTASDLYDYGCPDCTTGIDFLSPAALAIRPRDNDRLGIITNPPFTLLCPFVERGLELAPYVAVFARSNWLESKRRFDWFTRNRLTRQIYISDRLPMVHRPGFTGRRLKRSTITFSWFVFENKPYATDLRTRRLLWERVVAGMPSTPDDFPPDVVAVA